MSKQYDPKKIEAKWRRQWEQEELYQLELDQAEKPFYNLMMFPYPSGEGLHVGHTYAFGGADTYGRFMRMQGYDVFEPMGFDAFGIHSENFAIKKEMHPEELIEKTTTYFREEQMKPYGGMWDWSREVNTTDPDYYQWTQWLFVQMFKNGLAERKESFVNWCPSCKTVLSDEQVENKKKQGDEVNVCERCKSEVERKKTKQWFFKITEYAEELLDYHGTKWPKSTREMQRNWIGKSTGIEIEYQIKNSDQSVVCFTTRPDTNFGATFIVLAPDHPLVDKITSKEQQAEVDQYVEKALNKTEQERKASKEKTGVFTGCYAVNNLNGEELPIYVADFVLMDYGTGAVVGVPGHDLRDFEFAQAMELPVKRVVVGPDQDDSEITSADQVQEETGTMVNSEFLNGMDIHQATKEIMDYFEEKGWGRRKTTYKLRDWCISRQRYWGPPIPMIYCEHCAQRGESWFTNNPAKEQTQESVIFNNQKRMELAEKMAGWYPVAKKDLPVELPFIEEYQPKGQGKSPLAERKDFYKTECPRCGKAAVRETDVSDTFLDSSWYFFRYPSTECQDKPFDKQRTDKWLPVDMYIGGNEHAVLHLMYTRFITMFLHDLGMIDFVEPFKQFVAHGLIIKDGAKMSKSRGNVINPTEYMDKYGADALRMYMLFLGPYQQGGDFRDTGMVGMYKFLARVYRLAVQAKECEGELNKELSTKLHQTIKKMGEDFSSLDFNTAIAALMELVNVWQDNKDSASREVVEVTARLIAPVAPHLGEELWEMAGKEFSVVDAGWPKYDAEIAQEELVEVVVQVDGKIRDKFQMKHEQAEEEQTVLEKAKQSEKIAKYLKGEEPDKVFFVPGKLINLVVDNG